MKCPYCSSVDLKVVDKRVTPDELGIRRRRECVKCEKRFTTHERIENTLLTVIKKDGRKEEYSREKLMKGLRRAVEKRNISEEQLNGIINKIESKLRSLEDTEIPSKKIGEEVMRALRKLDKVAYIRFASVYLDFQDVSDFEEEVKKLK